MYLMSSMHNRITGPASPMSSDSQHTTELNIMASFRLTSKEMGCGRRYQQALPVLSVSQGHDFLNLYQ